MDELNKYEVQKLVTTQSLSCAIKALSDACERTAGELSSAVDAINEFLLRSISYENISFKNDVKLCAKEQPKWVRIYYRTKKRRTRKKYKKRILQYYYSAIATETRSIPR